MSETEKRPFDAFLHWCKTVKKETPGIEPLLDGAGDIQSDEEAAQFIQAYYDLVLSQYDEKGARDAIRSNVPMIWER